MPREKLVISTKVFWGPDSKTNPVKFNFFIYKKKKNGLGLSRKHVIEGVRASLKRLDLAYVDIVFAHRFDNHTPLEETVRAFDWLVRKGYAYYWGTSEWSAANIFEAIALCNKYNLIQPVAD